MTCKDEAVTMPDIREKTISRRDFLAQASALAALPALLPVPSLACQTSPTMITIDRVDANFEREPLIRPFGFKGGFLTEIWQSVALMQSTSGHRGIGLGTQNVLWSDAGVFEAHTESGGNTLMYALTEYALQRARGMAFETPLDLLDALLDDVYDYGKRVTGNPDLRKTFALNALVAVDNAAWLLYAAEHGLTTFDALIPEAYSAGLAHRHEHVISVPSIAYTIPIEEIEEAAQQGYFFMKIKLGMPGSQQEMLEQDRARLTAIHNAIGHLETPHTANGQLPYYFDPNGRYQSKETLLRLLDHADKIGALDQIAVFEEPFPEHLDVDVSDLGVPVAADESAHTDEDVAQRIGMGYSAIALKAIAKTLSMTMKMAQVAHDHGVPCLCADLTVNPILVDWNKNVAARLAPLPGFKAGLMETNGHQNYKHWDRMAGYHPRAGASWTQTRDGLFHLDQAYYDEGGGILLTSDHYEQMFPAR